MADSTPTVHARRTPALLTAVWAVLVLALSCAPAALADGDPASDVLAAQSLFLPADGGFSQAEDARLTALLASSQRSGYPLRLAVIATPSDLGSVSALWGAPSSYARFLGEELSLVYRGTLLVVMPAGFGVDVVGSGPGGAAAGARAVASLGTPPRGTPMVAAALTAIQKLAADAGHRLAPPSVTMPASGSASPLGSVDLGSWLALAAGAAAVAAAWTASLRARPARLRRTR